MTTVKEFQKEREKLIQNYLRLQDEADALNEKIYRVCCVIETLNCKIDAEKKEEKMRKKAVLKSNGNGSSYSPPA